MPLVQIDWNHLLQDQEQVLKKKDLLIEAKNCNFDHLSFVKYLEDLTWLKALEQKAKDWKNYKHFVVLGMGGSALGSKMMFDFLKSSQEFNEKTFDVIDSLDPEVLNQKLESLDYTKTVFQVVSKSGNTLETLLQLQFFLKKLKKHCPQEWKNQIAITTDNSGGFLRQFAIKEKISLFEIPNSLGGRFSLLSSVAMLAASFLGFDVRALLEYSKTYFHLFANQKPDQNDAYKLAAILHDQFKNKERQVLVLWFYAESLLSFGAWMSQLFAESLGKMDEQGNSYGLTPLICLGPKDQHSLLQLFEQGPNKAFFIFFNLEVFKPHLPIFLDPSFSEWFTELETKNLGEVLSIQSQSVKQSLKEAKRDLMSIEIKQKNEETLAYLISLSFMTTVFVAQFAGVNPFDQPGVERAKNLTFEKMSTAPSS